MVMQLNDTGLRALQDQIAEVFRNTDNSQVGPIIKQINDALSAVNTPEEYFKPVSIPSDMAKQTYGLDVPDGWSIQAAKNTSGGVDFSLKDPTGWTMNDNGSYTAPDGTDFTHDELQQSMDVQEALDRNKDTILRGISDVVGMADWPAAMKADTVTSQDIMSFATSSQENSNAFIKGLVNLGTKGYADNNQSEISDAFTALKYLGFKDSDLQSVFPKYAEQVQAANPEKLGFAGQVYKYTVGGFIGGVKQDLKWLTSAFNVVDAPWSQQFAKQIAVLRNTPEDQAFLQHMDNLYNTYGWVTQYTKEAAQAYDNFDAGGTLGKLAISFSNPAYLITGTVFAKGVDAYVSMSVLSKVPALTSITRTTAELTQFFEDAIAKGTTTILGAPFKGIKAAHDWFTGAGVINKAIGDAFADGIAKMSASPAVQEEAAKLVPELKNVYSELPSFEELSPAMFVDVPARKLAMASIKTPIAGKYIEKLWRNSVDSRLIAGNERVGSLLQGEIGKIALYNLTLRGMGTSEANQLVNHLRAITMDPIKFFGLDENGISHTIKVLAGHEGEARTIFRIFENPAAFDLTADQLRYIAVMHSVTDDMYKMMLKDGIVVEKTAVADLEHYVHRVVTEEGKGIGGGMRGKIGRTPSFAKHRTVDQVTEEVAQAIPYERNPEVWLKDYVTQAITKIADKRMADLVKNLPGVHVALDSPVFKEFTAALTNAERGGLPNPQSMNRIAKEFPGLGQRFRQAIRIPTVEDETLRGYLQKSWDQIKGLQKTVADQQAALKAGRPITEAVTPVAEVAAPSIESFTKAITAMSYDDRMMFLDTFENRIASIDQTAGEMSQEIQDMKEYLAQDPIASFRGNIGRSKTSLFSLMDRYGKFPETITPKQADILLMGRELKPNALNAEGRVRWGYVTDELASHFGMGDQEFVNRLEELAAMRTRIKDLQSLMDETLSRKAELESMRDAVHAVNLKAENLPMDENARPAWVAEKPLPTGEDLLQPPAQVPGTPEAGLQSDIFGGTTEVRPAGKGKVTQLNMEDQLKYQEAINKAKAEGIPTPAELNEIAGLPKTPPAAKPVSSILDEIPARTSLADRKVEIQAIRKELMDMARPVAHLGESSVDHPAFRNWVLPPEISRMINYYWGDHSNAFLKATATGAGILRLQATADFSALMLQGLPAMGRTMATLNPEYMATWLKAWGKVFEVWLKPQEYAKWAVKNTESIQQRIAFGGSASATEWYEVMPAVMKGARHIPGGETALRETFGRFDISFSMGIDYMRQETWKALSTKAIADGHGYELAQFCDHMVGVVNPGTAGVPRWLSDFKSSFVWFAPRYTEACLHLIGDIFCGGYTRRQALLSLMGMMGVGTTAYYLTCKALGEEPNFKPVSGKFLTVNIGGFNIGIGGFWYGMARLCADIWVAGKAHRWGDLFNPFECVKEGALNQDMPFLAWWYKRSSPLAGMLIDTLWQHKDVFSGNQLTDPLSYTKYFADKLTPIAMQSVVDPYMWGGRKAGPAVFISEELGLRTYPQSLYDDLSNKAQTFIGQMQPGEILPDQMDKWSKGKLTWNDLTKEQQATLKLQHPELNDMEQAAKGASAAWSTPLRSAWLTALANAKDYKIRRGNALTTDLMNGVDSAGAAFTTKNFREQVKDMNTAYGVMYDQIQNDSRYAEIYAGLNRKNPQDAETVDVAYYNYLDTIVGGQFESADGIFNAKAYDAAIAAFKDTWGIDIYNQIQTILESNKMGENPLVVRLWKDKNTLAASGYWDMPYDASPTPEQVKARNDFLAANPNIDAILFFWGYRSDLETSAAYNDVVAMCKDSGVPYTAVGGTSKLPPTSVAQDYLDYKAQGLTGWDKDNYLRDHQALYEWGQANLGWDTIDFNSVPPPSTHKLLDEYDAALTGTGTKNIKLLLRCQSQELDNWLVTWDGMTPVFGGDKCSIFGLGPTKEPPVLIYGNNSQ